MLGQHRVDPLVHNANVLSGLVFDRVGLPGKRHPEVAIGGVGREQVRKLGFQGVEQGREVVEGGHAPILTGTSTTGLTATAPSTAAAITATVNSYWVAVR